MKINRNILYTLYTKKIADICETCDWKTHFGPEEIVNILAGIIENHAEVYTDLAKDVSNNQDEIYSI